MITSVEKQVMDLFNTRRVRSSSGTSNASSASAGKAKSARNQRKSSSLPPETVEYLKAWMMSPEHVAHPYPTEQEKLQIMVDTGIELKQLTNWFVNNRKRFWKPRVEAKLNHYQVNSDPVPATHSVSNVVSPSPERSIISPVSEQGTKSSSLTLDMTQPQQLLSSESLPTIIPSEGFSKFLSVARAVSDASTSESDENASCASSNEDLDNDITDELDHATGIVTRTESVHVHVLRPLSGDKPCIEDVTILSGIPASRIIKSYQNCMMIYTFPQQMVNDRRKIQSRRDSEIVRLKKHFLRKFLNDSPVVVRADSVPPTNDQKRKREETIEDYTVVQRPKYPMNAPDMWKGACKEAPHIRCSSLPNLEEAARLFGYTQ